MLNWERHFRSMKPGVKSIPWNTSFGSDFSSFNGFFDDVSHVMFTPVQQQVADKTLATDNLNAVNDYIHRTPTKTAKAASLASDWARWWTTTGSPTNYTFVIPVEVWDEARNRKLAFNLANATTREEVDFIKKTATTGMSTEQMQGLTDRRDPTTGTFFVPPPPPKPLLPAWVFPVAIVAVAAGVGLSLFPTLRKLVFPV